MENNRNLKNGCKDKMNEEEIKKYRKAGKIAEKAREKSKEIIKKGKGFLETSEAIEKYIEEKGGKPAFPVNLSINEEAAHYTPGKDTDRKFNEKQIVKVDIGAHVDGYVGGDTAYTIDFTEENPKLIEASKEALENAISLVKKNRKIDEISKEIQRTIEEKGFKPIRNLTGHGLGKWKTHESPVIPNIKSNTNKRLREGQIIAIEPFASTGIGRVKEGTDTEIYSYDKKVPIRGVTARKIIKHVKEEYNGLPFAERWISGKYQNLKFKMALRKLTSKKALKKYPVLKDSKKSFVSQAEKTVIVEEEGCEVLTD